MDGNAGVFAGGRLKPSGPSTLEIDHIVSLELGGSNAIANLYPEEATLPANAPGFHIKDRLENKLHDLVCDGTMTLRSVQRQIAEKLAGTLQVGVRSHSDWLGGLNARHFSDDWRQREYAVMGSRSSRSRR
ncbi:MAG: HNH endonuclease signature motif containing protein [Solirubrobacteraceae bacterium]